MQPFYKFIQRTYAWHVVAMFGALFAVGGLPAVVWGGAMRAVWVYHITWFVNSASHCWGYQVNTCSTPPLAHLSPSFLAAYYAGDGSRCVEQNGCLHLNVSACASVISSGHITPLNEVRVWNCSHTRLET